MSRHKTLTAAGTGLAVLLGLCSIGGLTSHSGNQDASRSSTTPATAEPVAERQASALAASEKVSAAQASASQASASASMASASAHAAAEESASAKAAAERAAAAKRSASAQAASRSVVMPDLVGLKLNIAMDATQNVGLTDVTVCRTPGGDVPLWFSHWRVTGQDVPAGTRVRADRTVCLDAMKDSDM